MIVPSKAQVPTPYQEGDSKKTSHTTGKYKMSEESKTAKRNNQIRVSYHKEETTEQKNGETHSTTKSYVKYYTETGYARKKENKKFWKKFWKILGWTVAILALVGTLYISTFRYQQTNGPLNNICDQPTGSQQFKKKFGSDPKLDPKSGSPKVSLKQQIQTEIGSSKVTNRSTSRQSMTPAQ